MADDDRQQRLWHLLTSPRNEHGGRAGLVCGLAVTQVAVDAAAVSLWGAGGAEDLVAVSDRWAQALEELQYTLGEGPGVAAFAAEEPVAVTDLRADKGRWPGFEDTAVADGVAAVFAFPIGGQGVRLGTLDLYRRRPGELSAEQLADAIALADLAMIAVLSDTTPDEITGRAPEGVPGHYDEVHIAVGMLAAHLRIAVDAASVRLRAHAFSSGRSLLDIAHAVISCRFDMDAFDD